MVKTPIYELLGKIGNRFSEEDSPIPGIMTGLGNLGVTSIEDLCQYSSDQLIERGFQDDHLDVIRDVLEEDYGYKLGTAPDMDESFVQDHGTHLVVRGTMVQIPTGPRSIGKEELVNLYEVFGHQDAPTIRTVSDETGISYGTVRKYLGLAKLVEVKKASAARSRPAGGAPPSSGFALARQGLADRLFG